MQLVNNFLEKGHFGGNKRNTDEQQFFIKKSKSPTIVELFDSLSVIIIYIYYPC